MGDSIKQARAFMRNCETALTTLDYASDDDAVTALVSIQSGAKLNHARAIYRAAQDAIENVSTGSLEDRVAALTHLIKQYDNGLVELENDQSEPQDLEDTLGPDVEIETQTLAEPESSDVISSDVISVDFSDEARRLRAIDAVTDSLSLAKDKERTALSTLLSFSQGDQEQDAAVETIIPIKPTAKPRDKVSLESFISDVVQQGLTFARQCDVTLSLSYDMGAIALPAAKAAKIKQRMERWLGCLVGHVARQSDAGALAHIDMSATPAAVILSVNAPALNEDVFAAASDKDCVVQHFDTEAQRLSLHLSLTEGAPLLKTHKLPVEEGIGARLDALLADTQGIDSQIVDEELALADTNLLAFDSATSKKQASS
jgi:hypothetical protein